MLVNCNSCQKKFIVPDSAITEAGRLLQCGSCGNKWTQYPIKEKAVKTIEQKISNKIKQPDNANSTKTSSKNKKRKINLYSEKYLEKKYGLTIKDSPERQDKKKESKSSFSFFNYLIIIIILIMAFFGVINLSKDIIVTNYPGAIPYIDYLYKLIEVMRTTIYELVN